MSQETTKADEMIEKVEEYENGTVVRTDGYFLMLHNNNVSVSIRDDRESRKNVFFHGMGAGILVGSFITFIVQIVLGVLT